MSLPIYRLRRWLVVIAALFTAVVAGMYFYARSRQRDVLKDIPNKLGFDIKQTANGFQFSKSDGKRTLFTIQASDVKQFKLNGHAELRNVSIVLYGRDSSRFDQIYGDDFTYDKKAGNITASGDVQIDLQANPKGLLGPDQGTPKELKNPIHINTRDLVFNQESGDASTNARVDFRTPQASGWAVGLQYSGKNNLLTFVSQIHVTLAGQDAASLSATHGTITRDPRVIVLEHPRLERASGTLQADQATFLLGHDNNVERVLATGDVKAEAKQLSDKTSVRADEAELLLTDKGNLLNTSTLTGHVHAERIGSAATQGDAGRVIVSFGGENQVQKVHAEEGVRLAQRAAAVSSQSASSPNAPSPQDFDLTSAAIDFFVAGGRRLDHAETSGAAQITISPAQGSNPATRGIAQRTVITAGQFNAKFTATPEGENRLTSIHGSPNAKIMSFSPGQPDRISTSQALDATFLEQGIASIVQQGAVAFSDGQPPERRTQAWADKALYTPSDRILTLTGSPRVAEGAMVTTARTIRINRANDDAFAEGDVKSSYNELKEQPNGALLASASPIHVTAASMTAHNSPAIALYEGSARLWQDANVIEAPSIEFDRDRRSVVAQGTSAKPVSTVLVQAKSALPDKVRGVKTPSGSETKANKNKSDKPADTVAIIAGRLTYADLDRRVHYEGGVVAKSPAFTASSDTMDVFLLPRSQTSSNQSLTTPGQLDRMVAQGNVVIHQLTRRAEGHTLVFTAADDKFVLTGGPPSIFDAERGKITGVSLTFFRADDRVLVEGEASTPVVTQTRVAR